MPRPAAATTGQDPLIPSGPELIIGAICFIVVFGILGRMLLPRIQQTLAERTDQIEGGLARADEAQAEARQLLDQYLLGLHWLALRNLSRRLPRLRALYG